jgi:multiple sugar transport system permease protein
MTSKPKFRFTFVGQTLFLIAYAVPLIWIVLTSLKRSTDVFDPSKSFIFAPTLEAYQRVANVQLLQAIGQSVSIATLTTILVLLVAVPAAYALARSAEWWSFSLLAILIVFQMIPQTSTVIPLFKVLGNLNLLDTLAGVVIADSALMTPFAIILLRPFFRSVPEAIEEASSIDGAGSLRSFWSIILPIARNGVATTGTVVFIIVWGEFLYSVNFFMTPSKYPLSALLAQQVSSYGVNWSGLMALAVVTAVPIAILYSASYKLLKEGLTVGAVK